MTRPAPINPPVDFSCDLTGRIALVTGASSGLGWRFAKVLAACGAKVAVTGRRRDRLDQLVKEIESDGGTAAAVVLDVSQSATIAPAFDRVEELLGPVDMLINNAGIPGGGYAAKQSLEVIDAVFDTNLRGAWVTSCEMAKRAMARQAPGWIVNITSMGAFSYSSAGAASLYSMTKAVVLRMTEVLAMEWAKFNINVNAMAPGAISSEMMDGMIERVGDGFADNFPRKRIGQPDRLDSALLFLVSPSSDFVTGTCVKVYDGQMPR